MATPHDFTAAPDQQTPLSAQSPLILCGKTALFVHRMRAALRRPPLPYTTLDSLETSCYRAREFKQFQLSRILSFEESELQAVGLCFDGRAVTPDLVPSGQGKYTYAHAVDLLVKSQKQRSTCKTLSQHLWSAPLTRHALQSLGGDVLIQSPEFLVHFLLRRQRLDMVDVAAHLSYLCSPITLLPQGLSDARSGYRFASCAPLASPPRIDDYLADARGVRGVETLIRARNHLLTGVASPQELIVGLILALPPSSQGLGHQGIVLNYRVTLTEAGRRLLASDGDGVSSSIPRSAVIDVYDPESHMGFECQGEFDHLREVRQAIRDDNRKKACELAGIRLAYIKRGDLNNIPYLLNLHAQMCQAAYGEDVSIDSERVSSLQRLVGRLTNPNYLR